MGLLATFLIGFCPAILLSIGALATIANRDWLWFGPAVVGALLAWVLAAGVAALANAALYDCFPALRRLEQDNAAGPNDLAWYPLDPGGEPISTELPFALVMAVHLPRIPVPARLFLALWWLAHFAAAGLLGFAVFGCWRNAAAPLPVVGVVVPVVLDVGVLFAANLYLILAVAACVRRPMLWHALWRWRFAVDLVLAFATQCIVLLLR
jgi:hypothetical protein